MTDKGHTLGLWKIGGQYGHLKSEILAEDGSKCVATVWTRKFNRDKDAAHMSTVPDPEGEANAAFIAAAPETAAERDRFRVVNAELVNALELAEKYLRKAVAEDLMSECVRTPRHALAVANSALDNAQKKRTDERG